MRRRVLTGRYRKGAAMMWFPNRWRPFAQCCGASLAPSEIRTFSSAAIVQTYSKTKFVGPSKELFIIFYKDTSTSHRRSSHSRCHCALNRSCGVISPPARTDPQ